MNNFLYIGENIKDKQWLTVSDVSMLKNKISLHSFEFKTWEKWFQVGLSLESIK